MIAAVVLLAASIPTSSAAGLASSNLDLGYRQMYNLEFADAHRVFAEWEHAHPDDPVGPVSNAAAYLFSELERLQVLQTEFFTDNDAFLGRGNVAPDPAVKQAFEGELARAEQIAGRNLARSPQDADAMFAKVLALGLRGDYLALIEKKYMPSLAYMKNARALAQKLLASEPTRYDAYLAVGIENYLLGIKPAPVRWILQLGGAQTDKDQGLKELHLTAEKGHYLLPFARMLLAVAALRDKNPAQAKTILADLSREFPRNTLYKRELDRLH